MRSPFSTESSPQSPGEKALHVSQHSQIHRTVEKKDETSVTFPTPLVLHNEERNQQLPSGNAQAQTSPQDEIAYPHGVKLTTITVAVALSVFLVALVSLAGPLRLAAIRTHSSHTGQHYYCNCNPADNRSLPCPRGRRLVWFRLFPDNMRYSTALRQDLHALQREKGLSHRYCGL